MLKPANIRFLVLFTIFTSFSKKAQELFPETDLGLWNEEGCAEDNEKDDFSQEYADDGDFNEKPENSRGAQYENEGSVYTEGGTDNWGEQLQTFEEMVDDIYSHGLSYNRDDDDQGALSVSDPIAIFPLNSKYATRNIINRHLQGIPVGVSLAAGPDGKPGGSYQFSGHANSYIEFPNGWLNPSHSITMLCWIYPQNTAGPLFHYKPNGWGTHMWIVSPGKLFVRFVRRNYKFTPHLVTSRRLVLNRWYYVGASYDGNTGIASLWVNGKRIKHRNIGASLNLATQDNVRVGAREGDGRYFKGRITAMQVYDVALTAIQISKVENAALSVPDPIAIYPLNSKYATREIKNRLPQGTPVGVHLAAGPDGKNGSSYQFNGRANSYIEFPNNGGLDAKRSITMLCWIYHEGRPGPLIHYKANGWGIHMWITGPNTLFVRFMRRNYQLTPPLAIRSLRLIRWQYVGASYDGNTGIASLWLNGKRARHRNIGAALALATQDNVRMGAREGDGRYFKGRITAMQVYDVALTAAQINEVRLAGQGNRKFLSFYVSGKFNIEYFF